MCCDNPLWKKPKKEKENYQRFGCIHEQNVVSYNVKTHKKCKCATAHFPHKSVCILLLGLVLSLFDRLYQIGPPATRGGPVPAVTKLSLGDFSII